MSNIVRLNRNYGNVSEHFKASEFACKDGTDELLLDKDIIPILERFREYVEVPVTINSAYRTEKHNKNVGGEKNSYHLKGQALDIPFKTSYKNLISVDKMCDFFNVLGLKGIIKYSNYIHIDTRMNNKYHFSKVTGNYVNFGKVNIPFKGNLKNGSNNIYVGIMQFKLKSLGYDIGNADMIFGEKTEDAVRDFQNLNNLSIDGICGINTWKKLFNRI